MCLFCHFPTHSWHLGAPLEITNLQSDVCRREPPPVAVGSGAERHRPRERRGRRVLRQRELDVPRAPGRPLRRL